MSKSYIFSNCQNVKNFKNVFKGCKSIESFKVNMFNYHPQCKTFESSFEGCESLQNTFIIFNEFQFIVSENTTVKAMFKDCKNLVEISPNMLNSCRNTEDFESFFENCEKLTLEDNNKSNNPNKFKDFFKNCKSGRNLKRAFFNTGIVRLPLETCAGENFENFESTFEECMLLTDFGDYSKLFDENPGIKTFKRTFFNCKSLKEVPLFYKCSKATDFESTFEGCITLKTIDKENYYAQGKTLFPNSAINLKQCFKNCFSLLVIQPLPINIENLDSTFENCSVLRNIPEDLFGTNNKIKKLDSTFRNCEFLRTFPNLSYFTNLTDLISTFENCRSLNNISIYSFKYNKELINFIKVFKGCISLNTFYQPEIRDGYYYLMFSDNLKIRDFTEAFADTSLLLRDYFDFSTVKLNPVTFKYMFRNLGLDRPSTEQYSRSMSMLCDYEKIELFELFYNLGCYNSMYLRPNLHRVYTEKKPKGYDENDIKLAYNTDDVNAYFLLKYNNLIDDL